MPSEVILLNVSAAAKGKHIHQTRVATDFRWTGKIMFSFGDSCIYLGRGPNIWGHKHTWAVFHRARDQIERKHGGWL